MPYPLGTMNVCIKFYGNLLNCKDISVQTKRGEPTNSYWHGLNKEDLILRGVLFADLFKLLVPGGSAIVGFLSEPSDHVFVLIRVNHHMVSLLQNVWVKKETTRLLKLKLPHTVDFGLSHLHTYMALIPSGQIEFVGEEIPHASLLHFFLQHL